MVTFKDGSIWLSEADIIAIPVNTVGVGGKGLVLDFKQRYPTLFENYVGVCSTGELGIGRPMVIGHDDTDKSFLLFPTKRHWRDPSRIEYIQSGLRVFHDYYMRRTAFKDSYAFPALGCGAGGLSWDVVQPVMDQYLHPLPFDIEVYVPKDVEMSHE